MRFSVFLYFNFLVGVVFAAKAAPYTRYTYTRNLYCCNYELSKAVSFCATAYNTTCLCQSKEALATYAGCFAYKDRNNSGTLDAMIENCAEANVTLPEDWYDESYAYFLSSAKSASEIPNFNATIPIDVPFKFETKEMDLYMESYNRFLNNYDDSLYYASGALGYWALIFVIGAITHWSKFLFPSLYKRATNPVVNYWRKYVSMPATFNKKKVQEQKFLKIFNFLIPSRFETVVLVGFYAYIIAINSIRNGYVENDPLFATKRETQLRYVADRTGIIATMLTCFVYLIAGRNNFLQWVCGWDFATFITYHKHTARVMFCLVVIHAVCFTVLIASDYAEEMAETYLIWGTVATVAGGIILVQALLFFRRRWYEIFLMIHILMAVFWLVGAWIHVKELGYVWFLYPAAAIWAFDRVVRIGRLISFGFPNATIILESNETIKIIVPKPKYWNSIPGGHAFIHFLKPSYFWQSHPFTFTEDLNGNHIILFAKIKGGVTHSLYKLLANAPGRTCQIRVGVEGPYGEATPAKYADTPVFIAGGNGIPGIYSEAVDVAMNIPKESKKTTKLVWVVREYSNLLWLYQELVALKNLNLETTIYVTRPEITTDLEQFNTRWSDEEFETIEKNDSVGEKTKEDVNVHDYSTIIQNIKSELSHINIIEGRPNIETYIKDQIEQSNGSVAFVVCGASTMVDSVRYECCQMLTKSSKRIDFYEQVQVWA